MSDDEAVAYIMRSRKWRLAAIWGRVVFVAIEVWLAGWLINDWRIVAGIFLLIWANNVGEPWRKRT